MQAAFQALHVGNAKGTQIEYGARVFRDDVCARATLDDAGVDGDAALRIIPSFDAGELPRQFVDGVDPFLWCQASMRSAATHDQFGFTDALAGRLQQMRLRSGVFES